METELKFQIPPAHSAALRRAVATASARSVRLQALYADTADQRLAAAGLALRLRKEGRVWVQTLKGRGDGLMQRLEHEVRLPPQRGAPMLDPLRHAGTPVGERLAAALAQAEKGGAGLRTLYQTDIRRLHRRVRHGGALIEIAHDHGRIVADGRSVAVDEIEFELLSGPPAALPALAARWAARFDLWWDVRTKSERGHRLALARDQVPAIKASPAVLPAGAGLSQAWCTVLQSALAQALPNAAEIAAGSDAPEHLHQLRVALRRLRSALRWFADWSGDAVAAHALEADWREPFGRLGAARDSDVLVHALQPALRAAGAPPFEWPAATLDGGPGEIVRGGDFTALLLRTLSLSLSLSLPRPGPADDGGAPALQRAARRVLRRAWRRVLHDAQAFGAAGVEEQHRTRKRLKRFRYGLEFLLPLLARRPALRLHRAVCAALDALGHLNDLHTAEARFRACAEADARAWFAVGWAVASQPAAQAEAAVALQRMARLAEKPLPWRRLPRDEG